MAHCRSTMTSMQASLDHELLGFRVNICSEEPFGMALATDPHSNSSLL